MQSSFLIFMAFAEKNDPQTLMIDPPIKLENEQDDEFVVFFFFPLLYLYLK